VISAPEDYGLSAEQTLAHRAEVEPPADFESFWADFREAVQSRPVRWTGRLDERINEVIIPSLRDVRVVARVSLPPSAPTGVVVTTHGSAAPEVFPDEPEPWLEYGLVTVRLRVRGFPPSTMDVDDCRADWILHGIEAADAWILRGATGDLVQAVRCARAAFGADIPIGIHGESFGGGLAVLAAAQLRALDEPVFRMAVGQPTFGDFPWRIGRYCNGMGGQINALLDVYRDDARDRVLHTLSLFDACLHARQIECPVLCKLARRDDTVPAPSAAAVYHEIASKRTWRFETAFGHFDGGLADARRHALFERLYPRFLDPRCEPERVIEACGCSLSL